MSIGMIVELFGFTVLALAVILSIIVMSRQKKTYRKVDEKYMTDLKTLITNLEKFNEEQLKFKKDIFKKLEAIENKLDKKQNH